MKTIEVSTRKQALTISKKERGFQEKIERYQLANSTANYSKNAKIARLGEYLTALRERGAKLSKAGIKSLATWKGLLELYFAFNLDKVTEKDFAIEAEKAIDRDLKQGQFGKITKEQEKEIITYHTNRAKADQEIVEQIKVCLTEKGLLTGKDAANIKELERVQMKEEKEEQETRTKVNPEPLREAVNA